jgi:CDP-diacylglycerol--serine O-phosphatidyltransferase
MYKLLLAANAPGYLPYAAFSIAVFSALRLAIFNIDETQRDSFRGVPTPANALFISALPLLTGVVAVYLQEYWIVIALTAMLSWLLVSNIELFALKFKDFTWQNNKVRFTFLIVSVLLLVVLQIAAIPAIILLYIALSLGVKALAK